MTAEEMKRLCIEEHLERTGLADQKMSGAAARRIIESLGREYDENPSAFKLPAEPQ